jgi:hypothetical protein
MTLSCNGSHLGYLMYKKKNSITEILLKVAINIIKTKPIPGHTKKIKIQKLLI